MREECFNCQLKTIEKLIKKFTVSTTIANQLFNEAHLFVKQNQEMSNPLLATHLQRIASRHLKTGDLYNAEKKSTNELLLNNYGKWKNIVETSKSPIQTAAKLAVIGNIIDYGSHSVPSEIESFIEEKINEPFFFDDSSLLIKEINEARSILYLGDNAGEIVFDKLFIETLQHPGLTFVTRGFPVLNDITTDDALQVGIDKICKVISNGFDAPSTLLPFCSDEFKQAFYKADLIISKGQGNFEGLIDTKKNIFFLLMAKCDTIAELIGAEKGAMIIKKAGGRRLPDN